MLREQKTAGYVLVGGRSSRMGQDKALMQFGATPLAARIAERVRDVAGSVALVGSRQKYEHLGWPVVEDIEPGLGPLGGIRTALEHTSAQLNLIVGCDLPFITAAFLCYLLQRAAAGDAQVVVPVSEAGVLEAVCAVYRRDCLQTLRVALERGAPDARAPRLASVIAELQRVEVHPSEWRAFDTSGKLLQNVNTPADWAGVRRLHG